MRGKTHLTRSEDFDRVHRQGNSWAASILVLRAAPNNRDDSRFGMSVSKKVGNAVTRNRIKRRLREIINMLPLRPGWDLVIIVRPAAAALGFAQFKDCLERLLVRAKLLVKQDEAPGLKTD